MLPARLHSVVVSLILHAALLGIGATSSSASSWRVPSVRRAALEASIAVEATAGAEGSGTAPAPPSTPAPEGEKSAEETPAVRPRVRSVRPRIAERAARAAVAPAAVAPAPTPAAPATAATTPSAAPSTAGASESATVATAPPSSAPSGVAGGLGGPGSAGGGVGTSGRGGGVPGSTSGAAEARGEQLARYLTQVRARVAQHREYPYLARRANLEGTICLRISIAASGRVLGVTPTCGESHEPLLEAALKSVSSAAPFPPLPSALGGRLTLDVPVVFELDAL
jgi:periplasmic protein TonB